MQQYINLRIRNTSDSVRHCQNQFVFPGGILPEEKGKYMVICCRADYNMSGVPMFHNPKDMKFSIRQAGNPNAIVSSHTIPQGFYNTIRDVLNPLNIVLAGTDIGEFRYNSSSDMIEFKADVENPTKVLYMDRALHGLLDGFDYDLYDAYNGIYSLHEKSLTWTPQEFSTASRFYNRETIRVRANGLNHKTHIESTSDGTSTSYDHSTILTDQVLLGTTRDRLIYIPTQFRKIELQGNDRIYAFTVSVDILFADGTVIPLELPPNTYFSCLLLFTDI